MPVPTYKLEIDWNADGDFADTGEDVSARLLASEGLEIERGRIQIKSLAPPIANKATASLNNVSGDYNAGKATSPLYPNVGDGKDSRLTATANAVTYAQMRGYLRRIAPRSHGGIVDRIVDLTVYSNLARLVGKKGFSSALYGDGTTANAIRADQALGVVYDLAGIPTSLRAFDVCQTKLLWFCVYPEDELFDLAVRIWASEGVGAALYDGADGKTYLKQRYARLSEARSTAVQATYRDVLPEPWFVDPWEYDDGEPNIVNICSVTNKQRAIDAANSVIWSYGSTVNLGANETRTFPVRPSSSASDPIASVLAPVAGTDYVVSSGSVASGTFDRTSGSVVTLTLVTGAGGATVTGLQVRGRLARVTSTNQIVNTLDTTASRNQYGPKPYSIPTLAEMDPLVQLDQCNAVVSQYQQPRPIVTVEVPLVTDTNSASAIGREVSDRVRIVNGGANFDREMFVESVRISAPGDRAPRAFLGCEAAVSSPFAVWGTATWGGSVWAY